MKRVEAALRGRPTESLPAEHRIYRLARTFGWTPNQIDEQPAATLDWLLAIDDAYRTAEAEKT